MSWLIYIYYFAAAGFGVYLIMRSKSIEDKFLKTLLISTAFMLIIRAIPVKEAFQLSMLAYPILLLAYIVYIIKRHRIEDQKPIIPVLQASALLMYWAYSLNPRSFETQLFGYISIVAAVLYYFSIKSKVINHYKEFALIMLLMAAESIGIFTCQLFVELTYW